MRTGVFFKFFKFFQLVLKKHVEMHHLSKFHAIWPKTKGTVIILVMFCIINCLKEFRLIVFCKIRLMQPHEIHRKYTEKWVTLNSNCS